METGWENTNIDGFFKKKKHNLPLVPPPDAEVYQRCHKKGVAVIFNHKSFDIEDCSTRLGTEKDRDDIAKLLKDLRFNVEIYNDLKFREIIAVLDKVSKMDHSECECLVVAIMTHGEDGILYANDSTYPTRKLWTPFSPLHCPSLAGKPKLFFIQACRGNKTDPGIDVKYITTDFNDNQRSYSIPVMADILIMYATVEGYYAWRHPQDGSYFIQSLVRQMRQHHQNKDLLSILTCVNRDVAFNFRSTQNRDPEFSNKKEMCSIVSMLTRDFYLN